jgi:hypothetical protein
MTTMILGASNIAALALFAWQRTQTKAAEAALADLYRTMTLRRLAL